MYLKHIATASKQSQRLQFAVWQCPSLFDFFGYLRIAIFAVMAPFATGLRLLFLLFHLSILAFVLVLFILLILFLSSFLASCSPSFFSYFFKFLMEKHSTNKFISPRLERTVSSNQTTGPSRWSLSSASPQPHRPLSTWAGPSGSYPGINHGMMGSWHDAFKLYRCIDGIKVWMSSPRIGSVVHGRRRLANKPQEQWP